VDLCPSGGIANHLADDTLKKGSAGRAEAAPEVEGEGREEIRITGAESMILFGFLLLFVR
jgi:hypothetical protein